jgi:hypothetical protein
MRIISLLILALLIACPAFAEPSITSVSNGAISGASFGTRADNGGDQDYMCKRFVRFNNDLTDSGFLIGSLDGIVPLSEGWRMESDEGVPGGSNYAVRFYGGQHSNSRNHSLRIASSSDAIETLYVSFWYKQDYSFEQESTNRASKIFRHASSSNEYGSNKNYYMSSNIANDPNGELTHYVEYSTVTINQYSGYGVGEASGWKFVETLFETGANGRARIWFDGQLVIDSDDDNEEWDLDPYVFNPVDINIGSQIGYGDGLNYMAFDDYYIDYTQARIMVGDTNDFSTNTKRALQLPTSWANTSVSFTPNQGSFENNETVYLFVIDEDGTASAGHEGYFLNGTFYSAGSSPISTGVSISGTGTITGQGTITTGA